MPEPLVGIIANPASGRDIRRLVAHGTVFDNNEKAAIVRRVLLGLEAAGITRVAYMPDHDFGIVPRALAGQQVALEVAPLSMPVLGTSADSTRAAQLLAELGAQCIITLGGDGTNRAVAKGCGTIPLVAISTGTNNVFPSFLEGTIAGLAAGLVATGRVDNCAIQRSPWLEVLVDGIVRESALVDVVISSLPFVGARALWVARGTHETTVGAFESVVREVFLARVVSGTIGLSALGGALLDHAAEPDQPSGMHIVLGPGGRQVLAALAPGLVTWVGVKEHRRLALGDVVRCHPGVGTIALDGERELELAATSVVEVRLRADGPLVVDVVAALQMAARAGYLRR
jgi:hypothetical protein